ncbi:ankyrin [Thozetella sp. PMI_491]|nr:ankyrin [Thozetella sp. PMI_491]
MLLINKGADVDQAWEFQMCNEELQLDGLEEDVIHALEIAGLAPYFTGNIHWIRSSLQLATSMCRWDAARLFVVRGAICTGSDLVEAAKGGQAQLIKQLLTCERKLHPDDLAEDRTTALTGALSRGHASVVSLLLKAGASTEKVSCSSIFRTPNVALVRYMVGFIPDISTCGVEEGDMKYLENAILSESTEVLEFALSLNTSAYGSGAICAAVSLAASDSSTHGNNLLLELLRRRQMLRKDDRRIDYCLESTALSIAAFHGRLDIIKMLLPPVDGDLFGRLAILPDTGEWQNEIYSRGDSTFKTYLGSIVEDSDTMPKDDLRRWDGWHRSSLRGLSPLLLAIKGRHESTIDELLSLGCQPDGLVLTAAIRHQLSDHLIGKFIERCHDIETSDTGDYIPSPLVAAVDEGNLEIAIKLLDHGADLQGGLPLLTAVRGGHLDLVRLLVHRGADVNKRKYHGIGYGETALLLGTRMGFIGIVKTLLTHGADLDAPRFVAQRDGTAIERAAKTGRLDITQLLLDSGTSTQGFGRVRYVHAYLLAVEAGNEAVAEVLMRHRPWSDEDFEILQELREQPIRSGEVFIHPLEYSDSELVKVVTKHRPLVGQVSGNIRWRWWPGWDPDWKPESSGNEINRDKPGSETHAELEAEGNRTIYRDLTQFEDIREVPSSAFSIGSDAGYPQQLLMHRDIDTKSHGACSPTLESEMSEVEWDLWIHESEAAADPEDDIGVEGLLPVIEMMEGMRSDGVGSL